MAPLTRRPVVSSRPAATVRSRPVQRAGDSPVQGEAESIHGPAGEQAAVVAAPNAKTLVSKYATFQIGPVKPVRLRKINAMFYGPYGGGKTTLASTALDVPEMRDCLFVAAEPGDMSLTHRRDLDIVVINKYVQIARIFEYLVLHCVWRDEYLSTRSTAEQREMAYSKLMASEQELKSMIIPVEDQGDPIHHRYPNEPDARPEEGRTWFVEQRLRTGKPLDEPYLYRTVIVDSLSEVHKYLVYKFTGVDIGKTKLDEEIERMEEWQVAQEMFRLFIRSFRDLPMNSIFVAAEAIEPAERNKKRNPHAGMALPKLAGAAAADVAGFVDIVGYLMREIEPGGEAHRYLYLGAGYEGWLSKHRFENLPDLDFIDKPTLSKLLDLSRKDDELGSSQARPSTARSGITPPVHTPSPAAANSRRSSNPTSSSGAGRRGNSLRRAGR